MAGQSVGMGTKSKPMQDVLRAELCRQEDTYHQGTSYIGLK